MKGKKKKWIQEMFVIVYKKWTLHKAKKKKRKKMLALLTLCCVFMVVPYLTESPIISGTHSSMQNSSCPHRLLPEQSRL